MQSSLLHELDVLIQNKPSFETCEDLKRNEIVICRAPDEVGRMLECRRLLKEQNKKEVTDYQLDENMLRLDVLDKLIRCHLLRCAPAYRSKQLRVTRAGMIVARR